MLIIFTPMMYDYAHGMLGTNLHIYYYLFASINQTFQHLLMSCVGTRLRLKI